MNPFSTTNLMYYVVNSIQYDNKVIFNKYMFYMNKTSLINLSDNDWAIIDITLDNTDRYYFNKIKKYVLIDYIKYCKENNIDYKEKLKGYL